MEMNIRERAKKALENIRELGPLVHNITNYVAANFQANVLLAIGASPVMAHSKDEVEDMVAIANALVLNIGTPTKEILNSMIIAGKKANNLKKPVILDPVGVGATKFRNYLVEKILGEVKVNIIRGNASEIGAICGLEGKTKGVDSIIKPEEVLESAIEFSNKTGTIVAISGTTDYIIKGDNIFECHNGVPLLGKITGSGCAVTSIIGAFSAVEEDKALASLFGLALFGVAGEIASKSATGPGSFYSLLIDKLYNLTPEEFSENLKFKIKRS